MAEKLENLQQDPRMDLEFMDEEDDRKVKPEIERCRQNLPIFQKRSKILESIHNNKVVMIKGIFELLFFNISISNACRKYTHYVL